jgi:hypothetical protein
MGHIGELCADHVRWRTLRDVLMRAVSVALAVAVLAGGASAATSAPHFMPLDINRLNLIFLPSADVAPATGLMTPRGLQRSLRLASRLATIMVSVGDIHAIAPTTAAAPGADNVYDLSALESVEQLALEYAAPIDASAPAQCASPCPSQGLDAADIGNPDGANERLVERIIATARRNGASGNHVFSLPITLINNLAGYINTAENYHLKMPRLEPGQQNTVYVISIDRANHATVRLYTFPVAPPPSYPQIRLPQSGACLQPRVSISTKAMGLRPPAGINTSERVYLVRHAEAHPNNQFENGNYVCRGQWRALGAPTILYRKIIASNGGRLPQHFAVYGPDPSFPVGLHRNSYVRAALTVNPFAIAYGLPMHLAKNVAWDERASQDGAAIHFFFLHSVADHANSGFSDATLLLGWEHVNIDALVTSLLDNYYRPTGAGNATRLPRWNNNEYDTIWIITLDAKGNLTFTNDCEGLPSAALPASCPGF